MEKRNRVLAVYSQLFNLRTKQARLNQIVTGYAYEGTILQP